MHLLHYFSKLNSIFGSVFRFCQVTFYWLFKNCNSHLWKQIAVNWFNTNKKANLTRSSKYQRHSFVCLASFTCSFLKITASSSLWETPPWLLMAHRGLAEGEETQVSVHSQSRIPHTPTLGKVVQKWTGDTSQEDKSSSQESFCFVLMGKSLLLLEWGERKAWSCCIMFFPDYM